MLKAILIVALLAGCTTKAEEPKPRKEYPVQGEFRTQAYALGEGESLRVIDLPNRITPTRCWVYSNLNTHVSQMRCEDDAATALPLQGAPLEIGR